LTCRSAHPDRLELGRGHQEVPVRQDVAASRVAGRGHPRQRPFGDRGAAFDPAGYQRNVITYLKTAFSASRPLLRWRTRSGTSR
jgi:hypothetical protein